MSSTFQRTKRRVRIAQTLLLVILVGGTVVVADTTVGGSLFSSPMTVRVELAEAGGLHPGSVVNYRGQRIGKVTDVHLTADGVEAVLSIDEGTEVPVDSDVEVRNLSAVGEQYVDFRPRSSEGDVLQDGDTVSREDTTTPLPVHQVVAGVQRLMRRIDLRDIRTIATEADAAFGRGDADLRATTMELQRTVETLQELEPQLVRLLRRAEVPLQTGVDLGPSLRRSTRNLRLVAAELRRADPTVNRLIDQAEEALPMLSTMWDDVSPVLARALTVMDPLTAMSAAHLHGLDVWLDWLPSQMDAMAGSTRDGTGHVLLVPEVLKNCIYAADEQRDVNDLEPRPAPVDRYCTTDDPQLQQRGSQHVPRPPSG